MKKIKSIGILIDGNRRWAIKNNLKKTEGHEFGAKNVVKTIKWAKEERVENLTFYVFSSENWKRSKIELKALFTLFKKVFSSEFFDIKSLAGAEFKFIGDIEKFPKKLQNSMRQFEDDSKKTKTEIKVFLAVSYGGRPEIIEAIKKIPAKDVKNLTEEKFEKFLWSSEIIEPEIIIRTGGAKRLSNFLLWKSAYSEIFFVKKFWPDFTKKDFLNILEKYQKVLINKGK